MAELAPCIVPEKAVPAPKKVYTKEDYILFLSDLWIGHAQRCEGCALEKCAPSKQVWDHVKGCSGCAVLHCRPANYANSHRMPNPGNFCVKFRDARSPTHSKTPRKPICCWA